MLFRQQEYGYFTCAVSMQCVPESIWKCAAPVELTEVFCCNAAQMFDLDITMTTH